MMLLYFRILHRDGEAEAEYIGGPPFAFELDAARSRLRLAHACCTVRKDVLKRHVVELG